jgi:uncharacterized protein (TIGR02271 family)
MTVGESRTFTRSEEELSLEGRRVRTTGRIRLRKRIVEDWVEVRVPVRREVLEVVEEDVVTDRADEGGEPLSEQRLEIVLYQEEPVVDTRIVPTERVTVTRYLVEEEQVVDDTLARRSSTSKRPSRARASPRRRPDQEAIASGWRRAL